VTTPSGPAVERIGEVMRVRKLLIVVAAAGLLGAGGWYGWRWYTAPKPPDIPLEGVHEKKKEKIEQAREEVRRQPRSGTAWGELGLTLMANGFFEQSIPCFAHAQRFDPKQPRWPYFQGAMMLMFGRRDGFDLLRHSLTVARSEKNRRAILFQLALALVEDGQLDEAERYAQQLQSLEGDGPSVSFVLGVLALNRGDRAAARTHLGRLTDHPSARKRSYAMLAGLTDGDEKLAQSYWQRSLELPEDRPWPDSFEEALAQYRAEPESRLAEFVELEAQGRHDEALKVIRKLAEQSPDEGLCFLLGFTLFKMSHFEQAIPAFRQSLGFNPRNPKTHLFLGISLLQLGEVRLKEGSKEKALTLFREAVEAEDKALALQNDVADAYLTRGRALRHLNRTAEAIESFRQAVRVGTEYAEMHQVLGEALAEAGQVREGLEHLENAVKLAKPDDPRPRAALEKWKGKAKSPP
jgi:tetratricopeptide (TPR) repeat protein